MCCLYIRPKPLDQLCVNILSPAHRPKKNPECKIYIFVLPVFLPPINTIPVHDPDNFQRQLNTMKIIQLTPQCQGPRKLHFRLHNNFPLPDVFFFFDSHDAKKCCT